MLPLYVIMEMHIKTMRYYYTPIGMAKIQNTKKTKCWRGCEITRTLIHCWWEGKMVQLLWKTVRQFFTKLKILLPDNPAVVFLGIYLKELKTCLHKNLHMNVYSSFIHNCQNLEATQTSISR